MSTEVLTFSVYDGNYTITCKMCDGDVDIDDIDDKTVATVHIETLRAIVKMYEFLRGDEE